MVNSSGKESSSQSFLRSAYYEMHVKNSYVSLHLVIKKDSKAPMNKSRETYWPEIVDKLIEYVTKLRCNKIVDNFIQATLPL